MVLNYILVGCPCRKPTWCYKSSVRLFKLLQTVLLFAFWTRVIGSIQFELMEEIKCWKCLLSEDLSLISCYSIRMVLSGPKFWAFRAQHNSLLYPIHEIEGAMQNILGMCPKFYGYMYRARNACRVKRSLLNFCPHENRARKTLAL